jgi:hypothetical protein
MKTGHATPHLKYLERLIKDRASRETFYHRDRKVPAAAGPLWQRALTFRRLNGGSS